MTQTVNINVGYMALLELLFTIAEIVVILNPIISKQQRFRIAKGDQITNVIWLMQQLVRMRTNRMNEGVGECVIIIVLATLILKN